MYKEIIGLACFAIMFSETSGIDWKYKPLSCYKCMAWWCALLYFAFDLTISRCDVVFYSAITHITSLFIYNIYNRIR